MKKIVGLFVVFGLVSCQHGAMEQALELAGDNRKELEKVLVHYQDSGLKYDAARFLIENMSGCHGVDSMSLERLEPVYKAYDNVNRSFNYRVEGVWGDWNGWGEQIDSLAQTYSYLLGRLPMVMDLHRIKADYLIREIDRSFEAWQRNVYAKDASFDDFCEYVLPYRRLNGLVADHARDTFYHRHSNQYYTEEGRHWLEETDSLLYEYRHLTHSGFRGTRIPVLSARIFEWLRHGLCMHRCWYNSILVSSLGMPVAVDFVPTWGNRNNSHTWNVLMINGRSYAFEAFWDNDRWKYKRIYNNRDIDHLWGRFRLPKVYRYTYSNHIEGPVADGKVSKEDIPPLFLNVKKKDVSAEYFEPHDVTLALTEPAPEDAHYAYLAVFGSGQWHPVQWGRIEKGGSVTFRGMGKDIVYLPVYYKNGGTVPAGSPFKLESDGSMTPLRNDGTRGSVRLRILRGTPTCRVNHFNFNLPRGTRWVGLKDGRPDKELLVWKDSLTLKYSEADVMTESSYRYVRMYLRSDTLSMGEIGFHTPDGKIPSVRVLTEVDAFSPYEGADRLTDGIEATVCYGRVPERYIDFDLGAEYKLSAIGLYPYLISELLEGEYELYYWDDTRWRSVGRKEATGKGFLEFEDVPTKSLMLLKDCGKSWNSIERPFICEEGENVCWE